MYDGSEIEKLSATPEKILQTRSYAAIHKLVVIEFILVVFQFFFAIVTQQWSSDFGLDNRAFWYAIAIVYCILAIIVYAVTQVFASIVFIGPSIAFLVFNLLVFIEDLPQFWTECTEPRCTGIKGDFFYFFFIFTVGLIVVSFLICYYQFKIFRLEGSQTKGSSFLPRMLDMVPNRLHPRSYAASKK